MYSILFSKIELAGDMMVPKLKKIISKDSKVSIFPWTFPKELNGEQLESDFFKKNGKRYQRYVSFLLKLGVEEKNINICNCYSQNTKTLKKMIHNSDVLLFPGGNPEMLYSKVVQETEILYDIKHFNGIVIGESAGAVLQFKRYFITAKNNYYGYEAFYDGFGLLNDPFYLDVHTDSDIKYLNRLQQIANETKKSVYALYDDGCIIINRKSKQVTTEGHVEIYDCDTM